MADEITKKLKEHDKRFDEHDKRFDAAGIVKRMQKDIENQQKEINKIKQILKIAY